MNDLEDIDQKEVKHPFLGDYVTWRKTLTPRYRVVWRDIISGYLVFTAIMVLPVVINAPATLLLVCVILAGAMAGGFMLAFLALFLHEASHFNLHPNKKQNDRLANIFLGTLFGINIRAYRKMHWQHHLHLGTEHDTENTYTNALNLRFAAETFTGIYLLKVMLRNRKQSSTILPFRHQSLRILMVSVLFHIAVIVTLILTQSWASLGIWLLSFGAFFPFFAAIRQVLEHRHDEAHNHATYLSQRHSRVSRIFDSGLFSSLFGGAGFNKHMIHHWDPNVSYTRLGDVEKFLDEAPATKQLMNSSKTTYFKTFSKLIR